MRFTSIKINIMKNSIYSIAIILFATLVVACKKENMKPAVNGYWTGTAVASGSSSPGFIGLLYNSNGTIRTYNNPDTTLSDKYDGTYSSDPDSIHTIINTSSSTIFLSAKLNSTGNNMEGTARNSSSSMTATYSVTKL